MESQSEEELTNLRDGGALHKLIDRKDSPQDDWPGLDCMRPVNGAGAFADY